MFQALVVASPMLVTLSVELYSLPICGLLVLPMVVALLVYE